MICILYCVRIAVNHLLENECSVLKSPDYCVIEANEAMLGNMIIYHPCIGDQMGYYSFPSTPYPARLELIELRGEDLEEGFRVKEEYRDAYVTTYGEFHDSNMFELN